MEEDLVRRRGFIIMPSFKSKAIRQTEQQRIKNLRIAIERVHVERAIARLKIFQLLSYIRHDMYPFINRILVILAYTVNNFPPLIDDDEDEEFEKFLDDLEEKDPNEDEFVINDRFIADFDDKEEDMITEDDVVSSYCRNLASDSI